MMATASIPPEKVVDALNKALKNAESKVPGASTNPTIRSEVEAAVQATVNSADQIVEATRKAMEAAGTARDQDPTHAATKSEMEKLDPAVASGSAT